MLHTLLAALMLVYVPVPHGYTFENGSTDLVFETRTEALAFDLVVTWNPDVIRARGVHVIAENCAAVPNLTKRGEARIAVYCLAPVRPGPVISLRVDAVGRSGQATMVSLVADVDEVRAGAQGAVVRLAPGFKP